MTDTIVVALSHSLSRRKTCLVIYQSARLVFRTRYAGARRAVDAPGDDPGPAAPGGGSPGGQGDERRPGDGAPDGHDSVMCPALSSPAVTPWSRSAFVKGTPCGGKP
ncbi:hypothetical protein Sru01_09520 [Sphaerisporangium rufum]|uniref:Uncharacterized protein n=1 Tax=Sphaerisporangium rufum TaxID=1381558 RepID=A0A919R043_9ACTN|nr:hypothetical protein Sru01_09520 [Sphaerisporangium rufum]